MAGWLDKLVTRVRSADSDDDAKAVVKDYIDPDTGETSGDGDQHIHVHLNGSGKNDSDEVKDPDPDDDVDGDGDVDIKDLNARVAALEELVKQLSSEEDDVELEDPETNDARRFKMRRGSKLKTRDEDNVPDREPDMIGETDLPGIEDLDARVKTGDAFKKWKKKVSTRDSADMEEVWQSTLAQAEIIVPGFKVPTFDARLPVKRTAERLCALRRRVMDAAFKDEDTAAVIEDLVNIKTVDGLTCDSVKMAFVATAGALKNHNNNQQVRNTAAVTRDSNTRATAPSLAQMNEDAKKYWADRNKTR